MLLETKGVTKTYFRGGRNFNAVNCIDFQVKKGDFINIIGRSGSGKTTFLNLISGLLLPTTGEIFIEGINIANRTDNEISFIRNDCLGYIPQGSGTLPTLNIIDNVMLPFYLYKREGDPYGRAYKLLEDLGLKNMIKNYPNELSGGELKRVLIARALMNNPKVLIADEPTANLDVETSREVLEIFQKISNQGTAVILVSHELESLEYGKSCYEMKDGNLTLKESL